MAKFPLASVEEGLRLQMYLGAQEGPWWELSP